MPDLIRVLLNGTVGGEIAHIGDVQRRTPLPLFRLTIKLIHFILGIHVTAVIRQQLIMIAKVDQRVEQVTVAPRLLRAEDAAGDLRQRLVQFRILFIVFARVIALSAQLLHLRRGVAEDKEILCADVLAHLHVGPVQRTDGQRAV